MYRMKMEFLMTYSAALILKAPMGVDIKSHAVKSTDGTYSTTAVGQIQ